MAHVNLFDMVIDHLRSRKLLDNACRLQREKGDEALTRALRAPLDPERLARISMDRIGNRDLAELLPDAGWDESIDGREDR